MRSASPPSCSPTGADLTGRSGLGPGPVPRGARAPVFPGVPAGGAVGEGLVQPGAPAAAVGRARLQREGRKIRQRQVKEFFQLFKAGPFSVTGSSGFISDGAGVFGSVPLRRRPGRLSALPQTPVPGNNSVRNDPRGGEWLLYRTGRTHRCSASQNAMKSGLELDWSRGCRLHTRGL